MSEKVRFGFEDLDVWQKAIKFAKNVINLAEGINTHRRHFRLLEQLEASATSVASNIAEGKGRYSKKEYIQFLYIARGSLFETVTILAIFYENGWISENQLDEIKNYADEVGKMLAGLINSIKHSFNK